MSSSQLVFIPSVGSVKAAHSFLTFPCFSSRGGASEHTRHRCLFFFLFPLLSADLFKRATLSEMVNRRGTGSTHARLSSATVIHSYVSSSPDVLLTNIDFHSFIFTLRIWSPLCFFFFLFYNLKTATVPQ